jgi:GT2 family glycosyltransferase/glycosyltransferase involved in cell wall biosynthesis
MSTRARQGGYVELVEQAEGIVLLSGWVRLPPAFRAPGAARLRLLPEGGAAVERPLRRLQDRPDLPPQDGEPAGCGFQILLHGQPAWREVRADLLLGEESLPLGPGPRPPAPFRPRGHLGAADRHHVAGWAVAAPGQPPRLVVNGRHALPLPLAEDRPGLLFDDGAEPPRFGFRLTLDAFGELLRCFDPTARVMDGSLFDLALVSGDEEISHRTLRVLRAMGGALERAEPGRLEGWASEADPGGGRPSLEVLLDGTRWLTVPAVRWRGDLAAAGIGSRVAGGACEARLPLRNPGEGTALSVTLRPAHGGAPLGGARLIEGMAPWRPERGPLPDTLPPALPRVAVIVPIHNAAADLARCVEAVLRHTTGAARLILINDASTDPAVAALLAGWAGLPGVEVHANAANLGFTGTVNRGLALAGRDDVVLLNSDTVVGPGWLDGLRLAAHAGPRIGTVTPVSNNAGAFSVPELNAENHLPEWFAPEDLARLARHSALGLWPEVPTGNGFCMYVSRACLDAVGEFDAAAFPLGYGEENDFCMRATRAGFANLLDDRTLVWHRRSASFGETRHPLAAAGRTVLAARYPEYGTLIGAFRDDPALLAVRWRMRRALERVQASGEVPRPRVLFVLSTRSGGTPQTNRDLMEALADRYEAWTLHADGEAIELAPHGAGEPVERHRLTRPVQPGTHRSAEYDRVVAGMLLRHGFELVHLRHLAWHGLGLPQICRQLGIPVVLSFHDFYAICPTVKLLDAEGRYCAGRCTAGEAACAPELWDAAAMPPLRGQFVHRWRAMMAEAMAACDAFVTTSPYARDLLEAHFPDLAARGIRLVPHGRSFARMAALAAEPALEEPLRVLVPGNISAAKGGALIAAMAALDTEGDIEFHVLGAVDGTLREPRRGVVLHGRYERAAFAEHVREIQPHLAAVLSVWPETYCHTLTECWAAGLPVLGTRLGALAERLGAEGGGWLVDSPSDPAELLAVLQRLKRDAAALRMRREEVAAWQRRAGRHYDIHAMAAPYDLLYREVLDRRRSFAAARPAPPAPVALVLEGRGGRRGFRLPLPARNAPGRQPVFRPVEAAYPFGDAAGPASHLLLRAGALRPRDMPEVVSRAAAAGLRVLVEVEETLAAALAASDPVAEALAGALRRPGVTVLAAGEGAAGLLCDAGLGVRRLLPLLDPAAWLPPLRPAPELSMAPGRLHALTFADDPGLGALQPSIAHLAALGVIEPTTIEQDEGVARFRALAAGCTAALLPGAPGRGRQAERALACAAAGLVVLRMAGEGEEPGEAADGSLVLPEDSFAWVRTVAELSVDPERCGRLARRARRWALGRMRRGGLAEALDALLAEPPTAMLTVPGPAAFLERIAAGRDDSGA